MSLLQAVPGFTAPVGPSRKRRSLCGPCASLTRRASHERLSTKTVETARGFRLRWLAFARHLADQMDRYRQMVSTRAVPQAKLEIYRKSGVGALGP